MPVNLILYIYNSCLDGYFDNGVANCVACSY